MKKLVLILAVIVFASCSTSTKVTRQAKKQLSYDVPKYARHDIVSYSYSQLSYEKPKPTPLKDLKRNIKREVRYIRYKLK